MRIIKKYEVISIELGGGLFSEEKTENTFTEIVNKKIKEGFQPYGELQISVAQGGSFLGTTSYTRLSQVMVSYEDEL